MARIGKCCKLLLPVALLVGCVTSPPHNTAGTPNQSPETVSGNTDRPASTQLFETEPVAPESSPEPAATRILAASEFAERNDERLLRIYVGMTRQSVETLMQGVGTGPYANPFRRQMLADNSGGRYEVQYYLTRVPAAGRRITESQLTPVIFRENRVVAIGRFPLKKLRRGECPGRSNTCRH